MMNEDIDQAFETNVPLFGPECVVQLLRLYADEFGGLLVELMRSLASGGAGVDREPATVMRDLEDSVSSLRAFGAELAALNEEPDWDARVRTIATEHSGLCAITFYARDDMRDLRQRASRDEQRATVHLRAISLMIKALKDKKSPGRCVVCSGKPDEPKWLQLIMVLEGYRENPELTVAGGICAHCASKHRSRAALRDAVVNAFRERLHVDLRVLPLASALPERVH